ncbi:glucose-6-phosphate isomerase [Parendozoicomonas haliclonae]|uniref:Glucose-6-phosphate isomerase n=1 Tax=Parendozoicomonas haliclonae TaxID=1960125 RepID=A0A1X7AL79_9GAMM|nr:glucose-6-phosphate isomerase [Parendozoicomonas haliclonae]SMA47791.1 Glucose-6-phosphate isomerase [Parendozoicomonas haliclonae]
MMKILPSYAVVDSLKQHADQASAATIQSYQAETGRTERMATTAAGLTLDFSRHLISEQGLNELIKLAEQAGVEAKRTAMFAGEKINKSEGRAVLHTALRHMGDRLVMVDGEDVMPAVRDTLSRISSLCDTVHAGQWTGWSGKPVKHIVNIGIGGSYLGIKTALDGLRPYQRKDLQAHYVVNVDPADLAKTLAVIDPETTLFIICSKSFTTMETRVNAEAAKAWMLEQGMPEADSARHFIAVSNNIAKATAFGIAEENILPLWDWVGGRYSLWSAIGVMIPLMTSFAIFKRLLIGAFEMDEHFQNAPLEDNMPVIMGLLGIWYSNFFEAQSHAVLSYASDLDAFPGHLQQMDMESNGKRVTADGQPVDWQTGPVIWGGVGTNGQHAYHQLLHQGTRLIPVDIVAALESHNPVAEHQDWLFAHALAQAQALAYGCQEDQIRAEMAEKGASQAEIDMLAPQKVIPGNKPVSLLIMDKLEPETLGALIALYEHKVFVQGAIWELNSYDQFGVELGKVLGDQIFEQLTADSAVNEADAGLNQWLQRYRQKHHRA